MKIFVGNLSFAAAEADLKKLFEGFGNVASAVIVMRNEKKTPKSRGFGFVEMPDEQQALAALAALNGREFMGRVLDISPARPKKETQPLNPDFTIAKSGFNRHLAFKDGQAHLSGQPGTYNGGRRTRSYMKRRGLAGMQEEAKPRRNKYDNPMRWRKRGGEPGPWQKSSGEHKPRKKAEEGARPWKKSTGTSKPWKKTEGAAKPWSKSSARRQKSRFKSREKLGKLI